MQRLLFVVLVGVTMGAGSVWADGFLDALKTDDFSAAGLDRLTPEQRARLETLVETYKTAAVAVDRATPARVAEAQASPDSRAGPSVPPVPKASPGFFSRLKVTLTPGTEIQYSSIKSTIHGKFSGWNKHTIFLLENGQRWRVANGESYFTPTRENVEVEIEPASFEGFWMNIPELRTRVRVMAVPSN